MSDWLIILLAVLAVIVFFIILGLIFFIIGIIYEKKLPPYIEKVNTINEKRTNTIKEYLNVIDNKKELQKFNFEQFEIVEEDTLSTMRDKQDVTLILIKKIIDESKTKDQELLNIKTKVEELNNESEQIFDEYNRKVAIYNTFIRFIFARPYAYFAKKTAYPSIH